MRRITLPVSKGSEITRLHLEPPTPTLPIHYSTFRGLRWQLRVLYSWASPLLSDFSGLRMRSIVSCWASPLLSRFGRKFSHQNWSQKWRFFCENGGLNINFYFQNPQKVHPCVGPRLLTILREDQFWGLGCSLFEEPKKRNNSGTWGDIFHPYGEKKPWSDLHKILHWGDIQDVITDANLRDDQLRHFSVVIGQILGFSIGFRSRRNTTLLHYRASMWCVYYYHYYTYFVFLHITNTLTYLHLKNSRFQWMLYMYAEIIGRSDYQTETM